jgi:uncharacterized membrane protein YkvA (DUF1232 family)
MNNSFFIAALQKAASIAGKKGRLMLLLSKLALKLREVNWKTVAAADAKEKFFILGRLIKSYALGQYRNIPWKTILVIIAAVIYFVNPVDFIPDFIPIAGLTDDFGILLLVYNSVNHEITKFLTWEQSQVSTS